MSGFIPLFSASGNSTNYAMIRSLSSGQVWNGAAMVAWNMSNWATYVVAAAEQAGSGAYVLAVPGALPADIYQAVLYNQLNGGGPASGDSPVATEVFSWDGSSILGFGSGLNVTKINGSATAAASLAVAAAAEVTGAAQAGTLSTSQMTTNLTSTIANVYAGRVIIFTSGGNLGRAALITAYAVSGGKLTFIGYNNLPISVAPSASDTFIII